MELVGISLLIVLNLIGFFLMKVDKQRAIKRQYRISEKTLWLVALGGGAIGMTIGMKQFRHKTKHLQFKLGLPTVMVLQFAILIYFLN